MDWKEKVIIGMTLIQEGCAEAGNDNCINCPFENCNFPLGWDVKSEE